MQTRPRYIATKTHVKHHIIFFFWILDIHGMGSGSRVGGNLGLQGAFSLDDTQFSLYQIMSVA